MPDLHSETLKHLQECIELMSKETARLRGEVHRLNQREIELRRQGSDSDLQRAADQAATIIHVQQLESSIEDTREAVGAIVDELGIADRVKLGRSLPPGSKRQPTALAKVSRESKLGVIASTIATVVIIVKMVLELVK